MTCPRCGYQGPHTHAGASQPVYRRPRSHSYACRCPRCVQSRPKAGAEWIFPVFFGVCGLIMGIVWVVGKAAQALIAQGWNSLSYILPVVIGAAIIAGVLIANRRYENRPRPPVRVRGADPEPPGRLRDRATGLPAGFSVEEELARLRAELRLGRQ